MRTFDWKSDVNLCRHTNTLHIDTSEFQLQPKLVEVLMKVSIQQGARQGKEPISDN